MGPHGKPDRVLIQGSKNDSAEGTAPGSQDWPRGRDRRLPAPPGPVTRPRRGLDPGEERLVVAGPGRRKVRGDPPGKLLADRAELKRPRSIGEDVVRLPLLQLVRRIRFLPGAARGVRLPRPEVSATPMRIIPANKQPAPARPLLRRQPTGDLEQEERRPQEHQAPHQSTAHHLAPGESSGSAVLDRSITGITASGSAHFIAPQTSAAHVPTPGATHRLGRQAPGRRTASPPGELRVRDHHHVRHSFSVESACSVRGLVHRRLHDRLTLEVAEVLRRSAGRPDRRRRSVHPSRSTASSPPRSPRRAPPRRSRRRIAAARSSPDPRVEERTSHLGLSWSMPLLRSGSAGIDDVAVPQLVPPASDLRVREGVLDVVHGRPPDPRRRIDPCSG